MCELVDVLRIAEVMFTDVAVSIGTKHKFTKEQRVLIGGLIEFNPARHRRNAWDTMLHFDLYVKNEGGIYIAGSHDETCNHVVKDVHPCVAITSMAIHVINKDKL